MDYLLSLNPFVIVLLVATFNWLMTFLGASLVYFVKEASQKIVCFALGSSAGIMVGASFFSPVSYTHLKGCLRTYIVSDEGKEVTLYRLNANDVCILSAACVLDCIDFDVLVEAQTKCQIIQISPAVFLQLFSQNIHVELFSYKLATERFSDVMWAMQQILFISFDKRLATFLLDESNRNNSLDIKMTHEQIAQNLNSAREVVSRMLNYFAKEGYVNLSRGQIHIIDKRSLSSLI